VKKSRTERFNKRIRLALSLLTLERDDEVVVASDNELKGGFRKNEPGQFLRKKDLEWRSSVATRRGTKQQFKRWKETFETGADQTQGNSSSTMGRGLLLEAISG